MLLCALGSVIIATPQQSISNNVERVEVARKFNSDEIVTVTCGNLHDFQCAFVG